MLQCGKRMPGLIDSGMIERSGSVERSVQQVSSRTAIGVLQQAGEPVLHVRMALPRVKAGEGLL